MPKASKPAAGGPDGAPKPARKPAPLITAAQLKAFAPNCDASVIAPHLDRVFRLHGITTPRRIRHFMAHHHHESMGFTRLEENLNYSAQRLVEVWPTRFRTLAQARPYARNPRGLAEKAYGGRMGNVRAGDGWKYRGGGLNMLTGADNYRRAEAWSGLPLLAHPELAREIGAAAVIAASFWTAEGINELVDADAGEAVIADVAQRMRLNEADDLIAGTEAINGGRIGLADRAAQLVRAARIWLD